MKKWIYLISLFTSIVSYGQVGINTDGSTPDASSMLDVKSTSHGVLVPRMTTAQRDLISEPATGLLIFCISDNQFYFNQGTPDVKHWVAVGSQWVTNGNDLTYSLGSVSVGTATPTTSAALDVSSTTKGLLPPRMTTAQMNAIVSPVDGLVVYNLDTHSLYRCDGTNWKAYIIEEVDPLFTSSPSAGITNTNIANWNTAFGWGNHAGLYALLGTTVTGTGGLGGGGSLENNRTITHNNGSWGSKSSLTNAWVIANLTVDSYGHPTDWTTREITPAEIGAEEILPKRFLTANSPLSVSNSPQIIGTSTPAISITDAKANGTTKGAASFNTNDFEDNGAGAISIDYQNGQKATTSLDGFLSSSDWTAFHAKLTSSLSSGKIFIGNSIDKAAEVTMTGDASLSNAGILTLANSGVTAGTYGNTGAFIPNVTLDVKGRVTSASNRTLTPANIGAEPTLTKGNLSESTSNVLTIIGGTNSVIGSGASIQVKQAGLTTDGYLSSTDWNTFMYTKIDVSGVTYENLLANGDVGTGSSQVAIGNHNHSGVYEPANANIQSHIASTSNPHSVTKSQIGLGNVENTALSTWNGSSSITTVGSLLFGNIPWSLITGKPLTYAPSSHGNEAHTSTFITSSGVTYENLLANNDIGTGATQVSQGNHTHGSLYLLNTATSEIGNLNITNFNSSSSLVAIGQVKNTSSTGYSFGLLGIGGNVSLPSTLAFEPAGVGGGFFGKNCGVYGWATNTSLNRAGGYFYCAAGPAGPGEAYVACYVDDTRYKIKGNGAASTIVENLDGDPVIMFCPESPEVLFSDYGIGQLSFGRSHITLDPILTNNIIVDDSHPMKVFVQVEGECNGVYICNKSQTGFDVIELQNGHSNVKFAWSIVASRKDEKNSQGAIVSKYQDLRFPKDHVLNNN